MISKCSKKKLPRQCCTILIVQKEYQKAMRNYHKQGNVSMMGQKYKIILELYALYKMLRPVSSTVVKGVLLNVALGYKKRVDTQTDVHPNVWMICMNNQGLFYNNHLLNSTELAAVYLIEQDTSLKIRTVDRY